MAETRARDSLVFHANKKVADPAEKQETSRALFPEIDLLNLQSELVVDYNHLTPFYDRYVVPLG